jgi:hypothetical protein
MNGEDMGKPTKRSYEILLCFFLFCQKWWEKKD